MHRRATRLLPALAVMGALLASGGPPAAASDGPRMIKDLRSGENGLDNGQLAVIGVLGGRLLFRADTSDGTGSEVYRTNGSAAGTGRLKDINEGPGGSSAGLEFAAIDGIGYFTADDGTHGVELFRTDGTRAGTRMVVDIGPTSDDYAYVWGTYLHQVVFEQTDGSGPGDHGRELWRSNGTPAGTKRMTDVIPGPDDSPFAGVIQLGQRLLFISNNGSSGLELFRSSGTPATTSIVEDINSEPGGILSYPGGGVNPGRFKGSIWFYAIDGTSIDAGDHGGELWRSDGTAAGTRLVKDLVPGVDSSFIRWFAPLGQRLIFRALGATGGEEPWVTDGTGAGTKRIKDLFPGPQSSQAYPLGVVNGVLYLVADGGPGIGRELYRTDGTKAGTRLVKDIFAGDPGSDPAAGVVLNGRLYFAATNAKGRELWVTNGTAKGTRRISDINPGAASADVQGITRVGKRLIFFADDGHHGLEPWTYAP